VEAIFSPDFGTKQTGAHVEKWRNVKMEGTPFEEKECIFALRELPSLHQLASASADSKIRLWDISSSSGKNGPRKTLIDHEEGARSLAWSDT